MQSNNLDVELQRTLNELCTDLFVTSALEDCNAILQSLAQLAETFPQAQSLLGRLLSQNEDTQDRPRRATASKLSVLSTNFLYEKETACSAVCLLAALANDSVRNQRRIIQSVTGVKLDIDPSKCGSHRHRTRAARGNLYALTIPATVTSTYRKWRKRQRELQNCRLPSGIPPAHDGIPMPCYCDDCLGAEQFLSTWQQHFHDLSRWSLDPEKATSTSMSLSMSTEEFFRMFLENYQLRVCTVEEALGSQKEVQASYTADANRSQSLVYYFVSTEEATAAMPRTPVQFNPLHHLSAIAVGGEIDIVTARKVQLNQLQLNTISYESPELVETLATDQVILFTCISDIESCTVLPHQYNEEYAGRPHLAADSHERFLADFLQFEEQHGEFADCDSLASDVSDEDNDVAELLLHMLAFFESGDQIPSSAFRDDVTNPRQVEDIESADAAPLNVKITMTAKLPEQVLQIDCFETIAGSGSLCSFSTCVPQRELIDVNSTGDVGSLSLLCLSDDALETLLQRCRICSCDDLGGHVADDSVFYLRLSTPEEEEYVSAPEINDELGGTPDVGTGDLQHCTAIRIPLSGLSSKAKQELAKLETVVSEEKYRRLTCESLSKIMEKLAKVVADCNERISYLSTTRDKKLVRAATEVHRGADISRCRHCRNLLIQLGKKLALKVSPLDPSAPISQKKLSTVAKLVRTSIQDVLKHSGTFDPWETPDARVEKLQLDRRIWASGFPDAAYYQDTDIRRRENRKKQQQLSRKLLLQQQKSKDVARVKQRRD